MNNVEASPAQDCQQEHGVELPMLMVSALNGSQNLVSQGLRTLELCVDNLQPDFLYEHIQPVRAELMQALWRTLRNLGVMNDPRAFSSEILSIFSQSPMILYFCVIIIH